jgi:superfamily I DNA and/or RNA helicase
MRPEIAEIVSKVFYDNGLETPENAPICEAQRPFQITNAKRLPQSSIVIVDMPYWHSQGGAWARDNAPAHHNPGEIKIVLKVLSLIRCSNNVEKPAKLAVLTPYNQQVKRLKHAIAAKDNAELKHLKHFSTDTEMVQTIDSFQGKEADIVVVSLVRNNPHSRKKALGILADSRRMNVLLSRAKFKLVIVGSLNFLELRFLEGKSVEKDDELYFIYDWLNVIKEKSDESTKKRSISIIPPSQLSS